MHHGVECLSARVHTCRASAFSPDAFSAHHGLKVGPLGLLCERDDASGLVNLHEAKVRRTAAGGERGRTESGKKQKL